MRIGIHGGLSGRADNAFDDLLASARQAHDAGLSWWVPQLSDVEALGAMAVVGREVPGLPMGTAVVPTWPRHPVVMAMEALTVQAATGGRLVLGIGLSHQMVIESMYGVSWVKPVQHMREYLEVLMPLLHGEGVDHRGEAFRVQAGPVRVPGADPPPVVVAALGPQMLHVAGRLADGTVLWMVGPKTLADHIVPTITETASQAGRTAPRVVVGLPVSVTADVDASRQRAARGFAIYDQLPSYKAMLDREGVSGPADVAIVGDEEVVAAALRQLFDLGATEVAAAIFGSSEERARTIEVLKGLASQSSSASAAAPPRAKS